MGKNLFIGIVGGMGTAAGIYFQNLFFEICNKNGIVGDQNYPEWLYINASKAPDRTTAINKLGPSPVEYLISIMQKMENAGVDVVVVTCNSAHYFYEEIYNRVRIPWVHLPKETAKYLKKTGISKIGIMATAGCLKSGLFTKELKSLNIDFREPEPLSEMQQKIDTAIYDSENGIKYTGAQISEISKNLLNEVIDELDVEIIIAGCTELSFAFSKMNMKTRWIDPLKIAAEALFDMYNGKRSVESLDYQEL